MTAHRVEGRIRVLSWNLWWRFGPWEQRLPAIVDTIRRLDPDIACLQEVWFADGTSSARLIAEALGFHHVGHHRLVMDDAGFGNAIVSRWAIVASDAAPLSGTPGRDEQKLVVFAEIDAPTEPLHVFCTHLDWRYDDSARRIEQVREVCAFVDAKRPRTYPPILAGDFNAVPGSDEIRMLTGKSPVPVPGLVFFDAFEVAGLGPADTWSDRNPFAAAEFEMDRRIDYVFSGWRRPDGRGRPELCRVVGDEPLHGIWPSDHFGVLAELRA